MWLVNGEAAKVRQKINSTNLRNNSARLEVEQRLEVKAA
jgi:hypothetical protein